MIAIETQNLRFKYKNETILNGINLSVPKGAIYGYLGKNGEGKTTTIKLLLGLLKIASQTVYFNGKDFFFNREAILSKIGALIETPYYYSDLTAIENMCCIDYIYKCGNKRILNVLESVGLLKEKGKKVKHFSTGMKQRLGIAMAMLHDPEILLLDEPMNGLDPEGIVEVREVLLKLRNRGKTIFISSHLLGEIDKVCTHIGILNKGDLFFQGELLELVAKVNKEIIIKCSDSSMLNSALSSHTISSSIISPTDISVHLNDSQTYNDLIGILAETKLSIYEMESSSSSLESVFLKYTSV